MVPDFQRRPIQPGLPLSRDTGYPAHGNKQQSIDPTVPFKTQSHILRKISNGCIRPDKGIHHMDGQVIVNLPGLSQRIFLSPHNLPCQLPKIRRKADMGRQLLQTLPQLPVNRGLNRLFLFQAAIPGMIFKLVFHPKYT